jgi:nucleotide-binding universal stress UspA family protein
MNIFIVPTDFSQVAKNALEYACTAAKNIGAKVVVFNSYSFPIHVSNARLPASSMWDLEEQNTRILENRIKQLSQNYGIEVDYEYGLMTEVTEELDNLMVKYQGDALIMGMAHRSLAQDLFGNTTTSVTLKQKYHGFWDSLIHGSKTTIMASNNAVPLLSIPL